MQPLLLMYLFLIPCAALFLYSKYVEKELLATVFKGAATWAVIGGALAGLAAGAGPVSPYGLLIIAGLAMGLAGDVALSLPRPGLETGMVFFGLGHAAYILAMLKVSAYPWWSILFFIIIYAALIYLFRRSGLNLKGLLLPVIAYSAVVTVMLSLTITVLFTTFPRGLLPLMAGALFAFSDALLVKNGLEARMRMDAIAFRLSPPERGAISIGCYFLAQSLFAVSVYCF